MLGETGLRHWHFVLWREMFLNENGVGFALPSHVYVEWVV